jgi:nucleoid-associated protein YgaU
MKVAACFFVLSIGICSAASADEPRTPPNQTPAAQTPAAPAAVQATPAPAPAASAAAATSEANAADAKPPAGTAAAPAPKADKSEVVNVAATEADIKKMRGRGYKPVNRNGTLVFCRDENEIGSHFPRTHCSTLKQLKDAELSGKDYVNSLQQQGSAVPFKGP